MGLPDGPVADLACGPSGAALMAAEQGRRVTAVDVSEVALGLLGAEAGRRGLGHLITLVPVAAILVASIRLPFLDGVRDLRRLAHVPEKWKPVFRKGHAQKQESRAHPDSSDRDAL